MPSSVAPKPRTPKPGSQAGLRLRNSHLIIETLARRGPTTQATLGRVTGLSTGTVSNIVKALEQAGVVSSTPTIDSGRRALAIGLIAGGQVVLGIDIDRDQLRLLVAGLDQTIIDERSTALRSGHSPDEVFTRVRGLLDAARDERGLRPDQISACGISIATPLTLHGRQVASDPLLPNWQGIAIAEYAESALGFPCHVENDANAGALAQVSWGPFKEVADLVFVKVGVGIGAGIIWNHRLVRGALGTAGEIGHIGVVANGDPCHCGSRGCLETVASTTRIANILARTAKGRASINDDAVVTLAKQRDLAALRVLNEVGSALGSALASVCNIINPAVLVIGGPLAPVGAPLLDPIYRALYRRALPEVALNTTLVANQLGARTEALGAAALAIRNTKIVL